MPRYFSTFRNENDDSVETIVIHSIPNVNTCDPVYVLIKEVKTYEPLINLKICPVFPATFKDTQIVNDIVLIGCGDCFATFNLSSRKKTVLLLDGYFGNFSIYDNKIFVCSATDVTCLSIDGEIKWKSEPIAIDGVIINSFERDTIYCSCEWDPPGGWRPCQLELLTGRIKNIS